MAVENGEWILHGMDWDSRERIRSWRELTDYVEQVGFLPLFKEVRRSWIFLMRGRRMRPMS